MSANDRCAWCWADASVPHSPRCTRPAAMRARIEAHRALSRWQAEVQRRLEPPAPTETEAPSREEAAWAQENLEEVRAFDCTPMDGLEEEPPAPAPTSTRRVEVRR